MTHVVLNASVILALLKGERGASKVASVIADASVCAVNQAEVVSHFAHLHDVLYRGLAALPQLLRGRQVFVVFDHRAIDNAKKSMLAARYCMTHRHDLLKQVDLGLVDADGEQFARPTRPRVGYRMENIASPLDLFTLLEIALEERNEAADAFDVFKQDAVMAHAPAPGEESAVPSEDAAQAAAEEVDEFSAEVRDLLRNASDADLEKAYQQSGSDVSNAVAEALLGENKRRNLGN
jgi:uncharacterized protein with PIN domain